MKMPYKYPRKRAQYMREYRKFKKRQILRVKKALEEGRFELAKKILEEKPSISLDTTFKHKSKKEQMHI